MKVMNAVAAPPAQVAPMLRFRGLDWEGAESGNLVTGPNNQVFLLTHVEDGNPDAASGLLRLNAKMRPVTFGPEVSQQLLFTKSGDSGTEIYDYETDQLTGVGKVNSLNALNLKA